MRDSFWHFQTDQRQQYRSAFLPDRYSRGLPWRVSQCCLFTNPPAQQSCRPPLAPGPLAQFPLPGMRQSTWHQGWCDKARHADSSLCQDKKASCHCPHAGINDASTQRWCPRENRTSGTGAAKPFGLAAAKAGQFGYPELLPGCSRAVGENTPLCTVVPASVPRSRSKNFSLHLWKL